MDYDIAVIGGGPAGVSAAITAASKGRKVVLFEAHGFSPRLRSVAQLFRQSAILHVAMRELAIKNCSKIFYPDGIYATI